MADQTRSFWATIPGILTGSALLLTAITTSILAFSNRDKTTPPPASNASPIEEPSLRTDEQVSGQSPQSPSSSARIIVRYRVISEWEFVSPVSFDATTPNHNQDQSRGTPRSSDGKWRASDTKLEVSAPEGHRLNNVRIIHVNGPTSHHERKRISDGAWRWLVPATHETSDIRFSEDGRTAWIVIRAYTKPIRWHLQGNIEGPVFESVENDASRDGSLLRFDVPRDAGNPIVVFDFGGPSETEIPIGEDLQDAMRFESRTESGANWSYLYSILAD